LQTRGSRATAYAPLLLLPLSKNTFSKFKKIKNKKGKPKKPPPAGKKRKGCVSFHDWLGPPAISALLLAEASGRLRQGNLSPECGFAVSVIPSTPDKLLRRGK
jgi:hypothetical protein